MTRSVVRYWRPIDRITLLLSAAGVVTLFCPISGVDGQQLVISPRGTQVKTVNSGIVFTCTLNMTDNTASSAGTDAAAASAAVEMRWEGPDLEYVTNTKGSRVYAERFDTHGIRLYITKVQEKDAGIYTCKARIVSTGQVFTEEARMFLFEDIKFADTPTLLRQAIGSRPLLECVASGQPMPEVSWRFNRRKIPHDTDKYKFEERGLRIERLDLRDNGTYECRAEVSSHGNLKIRTITVDVQYSPVIRREPKPGLFVKGRSAELSCEADGNPPITYEWFKEKQMSGSIRVRMKLHSSAGSYVIRKVDTDDEGQYICRVSNSLGSKELQVAVNVLVLPSVTSLAPKIALEGRTVEIPCAATGEPLPIISWSRLSDSDSHRHVVDIQENDARILVDSSTPGVGKLIIQAVGRSDAGVYLCTATNTAGNDTKNMSLTVEFLPTVQIADGETELIGWSGEVRSMTCVCRGLPLPTVNWLYRGGQQISDDETFTVTSSRINSTVVSSLRVKLGDRQSGLYGNYSCIAKNPHGYMSKDVRLKEAYLPDTPSNVSVLEEASTWVRLSAEAPRRDGGMPVTRWFVKYELASGPSPGPPTSLHFYNSSNMTVDGLSPGVDYTFYLAAENSVGVGMPIKFRVRTPRRASHKEQADLPRRSPGVQDELWQRNQSTDSDVNKDQPNDVVRGLVETSHVTRGGSGSGGSSSQSFGILFLGITVGVATVLAALLVAVVVCFVSTSRNRRQKEQTALPPPRRSLEPAAGGEPLTAFDHRPANGVIPQSTSTLPRSGSAQPQPPTRKSSQASNVQVPYAAMTVAAAPSPKPCRGVAPSAAMAASQVPLIGGSVLGNSFHHAGPVSSPVGVDAGGRSTLQRRAWESMLQRQQSVDQPLPLPPPSAVIAAVGSYADVDASDRPLSMSELPPPPDFLLENSGGGAVLGNGVVGGGGAGGVMVGGDSPEELVGVGGRKTPALFEPADGYRSGDSVDDDIDDVDYTIRVPSVHGQLYR